MTTQTKKKPVKPAKPAKKKVAKATPAATTEQAVKPPTIAQVIENSNGIIEKLTEFGIQASVYSRPPDGRSIFSLGRSAGIPGSILIWPGAEHVEISVIGDKSLRQAVLTVTEPKRTITHKITDERRGVYPATTAKQTAKDWRDMIADGFKTGQTWRWRGPSVPHTATFAVSAPVITNEVKGEYSGERQVDMTVVVTAKIPASVQHFLVGRDETSQFICVLPRKVSSIEDAHKALRPKGVPATAPRQGEFFFVPARREIVTRLTAWAAENGENISLAKSRFGSSRRPVGSPLEQGSTHRAEHMLQAEIVDNQVTAIRDPQRFRTGPTNRGTIFVRGTIRDGRAGHHSPLQLDGWHRVVRNLEVQPTVAQEQARQSRRYD